MRELANALTPKVSAQSISKYESGKMLPSSAVLVGLGKALDTSLDFLMSNQIEGIDSIEFRNASRISAQDRAKVEVILIDKLERYLAIERILDLPIKVDWTDRVWHDSVASETQIDELADQLRETWHLGMDPVPSLCELIEEKGIKVVETDLPDGVSSLSCQAQRCGKTIAQAVVISNRITVERKRFTLALELVHRIIRSTGNLSIGIEVVMNRFAGAFLLPRRSLLEEVGSNRSRITYFEIIRLKHKYGVSATTVLARLRQSGVLSPAAVNHAFTAFARSWRKSEPEPIREEQSYATLEISCRFERLVFHALGEKLISPVRAATLLDCSLDSVEQQLSGPPPQ